MWSGHAAWRLSIPGSSFTGRHMGFWTKRPGKSMPTAVEPGVQPPGDMKIEISQSAGMVRVLDPRIFRGQRRDWCRALADSAAGCPEVQAVRLDLEMAVCEIQFVAQSSAHSMAGVLAA